VPAPTSVPPTPPRTNAAQTRDAEAPPQSASPNSPVEKTNTADTAQLSKPDEPIHALDDNAAKSASVPPPVPARVSPPKPSAAAAAQPAVTYNPPRPLKQVLPKVAALPPGAADAAGEVRVVVRVDESGRVIDARILDGRKVGSMLASAALTAAKQWIFEPASLRGKNIASDHTIVFQFRH
jgi:TonB family protein